MGYGRMIVGASLIELHHSGGVGNCLNPRERQPDRHESIPVVEPATMQRLHIADCLSDMRKNQAAERDDNDHRWHRNQQSQAAGVLRSKKIQGANEENRSRGKNLWVRPTEILKSGKGTERRSDNVIGNQEEGADNGDNFGSMANAGVNSPSVRIMPADGHVIHADERHQHAHGQDQPERAVAGYRESQANDVGFARAPIAVENRSSSRRVDITRPSGSPNDHSSDRSS